jgi:hypothetical protein
MIGKRPESPKLEPAGYIKWETQNLDDFFKKIKKGTECYWYFNTLTKQGKVKRSDLLNLFNVELDKKHKPHIEDNSFGRNLSAIFAIITIFRGGEFRGKEEIDQIEENNQSFSINDRYKDELKRIFKDN